MNYGQESGCLRFTRAFPRTMMKDLMPLLGLPGCFASVMQGVGFDGHGRHQPWPQARLGLEAISLEFLAGWGDGLLF